MSLPTQHSVTCGARRDERCSEDCAARATAPTYRCTSCGSEWSAAECVVASLKRGGKACCPGCKKGRVEKIQDD